MIALDTNLLIYAHRRAVPQHERARAAIDRAAAQQGGWGIPLPCLLEFWSVVTHPSASGEPARPREARAFVRSLTKAGASLWAPGTSLWERLTHIGVNERVFGPRVFDLHIALTALDHGATEIWTHDANFINIRGLRVHDPLA